MTKIIKYTPVLTLFFLMTMPSIVIAQDGLDQIKASLLNINTILNTILIGLIIISMIVFIWQVVVYVKTPSGNILPLVYCVIAIAIFASLWGLVAFLTDTTGIDQGEGAGTFRPITLE